MNAITIHHVTPQAGVRGGHVSVSCSGLDAQALETCSIVFGGSPTRPVLITPKGVRVRGLDRDTLVAVLQALG